MEKEIKSFFTEKGFEVGDGDGYTIWASLKGKSGFTLEFIYFKKDSCIYCRMSHQILQHDVLSHLIIENVQQLAIIIKNNIIIRKFYELE